MEYLSNGFTLELCEGAFPLSTDSIALADFAKLPKNAKVLDLGSGCGTLGLLLCASNSDCHITGIELDEKAHNAAIQNGKDNHITDRFTSICADLTTISSFTKPGSFDICITNPPYFTAGPESKSTPHARHENLCTMDRLLASAGWALKYGGDLFIVHKPERLSELFVCATRHSLEPKKLLLLRHKKDSPVALTLVQCRKGARPGLIWQEEVLHDADGGQTDYYRKIYHL